MKNSILLLFCAILSATVVSAQDKEREPFRFGFQVSPVLSFMHSNSRDVESGGVNVGMNFGMIGEYYFGYKQNYGLTSGVSFILNKGGKLTYNDSGDYLSRTDFSNELTLALTDSTGLLNRTLAAGTAVSHRVNFINIPFGFKMRTNYIFGTYIRGFAQVPMIGIDIATSARGDVRLGNDLDMLYETETIYPDIFPIGITIGGGLGIEYYPQDEQLGLLVAIFYNGGLFDMTRSGTQENTKTKGAISDVTLRLGVMF